LRTIKIEMKNFGTARWDKEAILQHNEDKWLIHGIDLPKSKTINGCNI
jgi:hypothetical protein